MNRSLVVAVFALLALVADAGAQTDGRFRTGVVTWTPTLTLRDAGIDSNVYDEPIDPKEDRSAVFSPRIEGVAGLTAADVQFSGNVDFVYFQRYASERSVNHRGSVRVNLRGSRLRPFAAGSFLNSRERVNSEIDVRARRSDREASAGVAVQVTPRGVVEVGGTFNQSTFRQGEVFRGVDLAQRLNRESVAGDLRFLYELTSLTRLVFGATASRDHFTLSPAYDADNLRATAGVEFQPYALLKGRATVGYHQIKPRGDLGFGFDGVSASVELGYVLLQRTRFDVRVARDASYSFEAQPYFLQTLYGVEILHALFERLDVFASAAWETLDYPGIPERLLAANTLDVTRYGGGIAVRAAERIRVTLNYDIAERTGQLIPDRRYERRRLYTTITYGF